MPDSVEQAEARIGEMLVAGGLVSPEQVEEALAKQKADGGKTFEILVSLGHLDKDALHEFLSRQEGVVGIDLANYELDQRLKELVPTELAKDALVIPIDKMGKLLTVAMACPLDHETVDKVQIHSGLRVKAMLCRLDDVKAGVEKLYAEKKEAEADFSFIPASTGGGGTANASAKLIGAALEKLDYVAPPPEALQKIGQVVAKESTGIRELVEIVSTHPGMAAWVLNVGNSAAYGLSQQVVSVALAAVLMGKDGMSRTLAALNDEEGDSKRALDHIAVSRRAVFCGAAASQMAGLCDNSASIMGTAGLLHEIGRLALDQVKGDKYAKVDATKYGAELVEEEMKAVGISYPEAGYILLSNWNLPDTISKVIRHHASPEKASDDTKAASAIVGAASVLAQVASAQNAAVKPEQAVKEAGAILHAAGLDGNAATPAFKAAVQVFKARFA